MQINLTGHHLDITPPLREYVMTKFQKLKKHFDNITNIQVTLTVNKQFQQRADAHIHLAGGEVHAAAEAESMYSAIDLLLDKLDRQVVKHKEKLNAHGHNNKLL
jgi:putative sigma-54 modulation protein